MKTYLSCLLLLIAPSLFSQSTDSLRFRDPNIALKKALIPSGGQFYNGQRIKGVIFGIGVAGATGAIVFNQIRYKRYQKAYYYQGSVEAIASGGNALVTDYQDFSELYERYFAELSAAQLKQNRQNYRRYRDISVISTVGIYALSIVDAYISAQLSDFDVGVDLSLSISPNPQVPLTLIKRF